MDRTESDSLYTFKERSDAEVYAELAEVRKQKQTLYIKVFKIYIRERLNTYAFCRKHYAYQFITLDPLF